MNRVRKFVEVATESSFLQDCYRFVIPEEDNTDLHKTKYHIRYSNPLALNVCVTDIDKIVPQPSIQLRNRFKEIGENLDEIRKDSIIDLIEELNKTYKELVLVDKHFVGIKIKRRSFIDFFRAAYKNMFEAEKYANIEDDRKQVEKAFRTGAVMYVPEEKLNSLYKDLYKEGKKLNDSYWKKVYKELGE